MRIWIFTENFICGWQADIRSNGFSMNLSSAYGGNVWEQRESESFMHINIKIPRDYKINREEKYGTTERKKDECGTCVLWN